MHVHVKEKAKHQGLLESYYQPSESCKSKMNTAASSLSSADNRCLVFGLTYIKFNFYPMY